MDATLSIAIGSSTQIALFVAPALVFLSYPIAPQPMDLLFTVFEVAASGMAVSIVVIISHDGETRWMEVWYSFSSRCTLEPASVKRPWVAMSGKIRRVRPR